MEIGPRSVHIVSGTGDHVKEKRNTHMSGCSLFMQLVDDSAPSLLCRYGSHTFAVLIVSFFSFFLYSHVIIYLSIYISARSKQEILLTTEFLREEEMERGGTKTQSTARHDTHNK